MPFYLLLKKKKRSDLDTDRLRLSGIIMELEILGEAAGQITQKTRNQFPNLPWKRIIGMRNRLIHVYFDVNHDIVWQTVTTSLPTLAMDLNNVIFNYRIQL